MKTTLSRLLMGLGLCLLVAACTSSPKSQARAWADRFPEEIGEWEFDERLELTAENQSPNGHITLSYEGDDRVAYIAIDVFATATAADVALDQLMRDWELRGIRFETERGGQRIDHAPTPGGHISIMQVEETIFVVQIIPEEVGADIPEEAISVLWETLGQIAEAD